MGIFAMATVELMERAQSTTSMGKRKTKRATIAETLQKAIHHSGEPVAVVARGAGVPQPVLHRFMSGERDLTLRTADKLLEYFDLEIRPRGGGPVA